MTGFWIVAALLTAAACAAVLWPFLKPAKPAGSGHDMEVYRDQLAEVDRDLARGAISSAEAEEAKAEIGRRILHIADKENASRNSGDSRATRMTASLAVLVLPVLALGTYWFLGSPHLPDQALETRLASDPAGNSVDELIARAERHLAENPADGRGWDVLAPIYLRVGRTEDAVIAYRNAIRLNGSSAGRQTGLGDALFRKAGGTVTAEAQAAFENALAAAPADPKARFFLALALAQQGDTQQAAERWRAMLEDVPENSPWHGAATQAIARVEDAPPPAGEQDPGPTSEDMQAAAQLSVEDRSAMIEGMVSSLDRKLRDNPDDPDGWRRLIRSYAVLGRTGEARDALERGLDGLGQATEEGRALAAFAEGLGIEVSESQ
jgi:cytochrome c-type biogenesis protein CcmH